MKSRIRTIMNFLAIYNFANVVLAFAFDLLRPYFASGEAMIFIANILFFLISAFSCIAAIGFVVSIVGVIYYVVGCFRWQDRGSAYLYFIISMVNVMGIGYFAIISL